MKLTFYSNFLNHHQLPFCLEMYKYLGEDFKFVANQPIPEERLKMGYHDMNKGYPFVITTYDDEDNMSYAMMLALNSDVVITGSTSETYVKKRMRLNKLTFRYKERALKEGLNKLLSPRILYNMLFRHTSYLNKNLYMLCASAYTSGDFSLVGAYKGKTYKWGYFPQTIEYDIVKLLKNKPQDIIRIIWCGRFLNWKHPEKAIYVAEYLKNKGYNFELIMIGNGQLGESISTMIKNKSLKEYVHILGSMSPEDVREYMVNSNIAIFTSDYYEGWGAVLNEFMNSGCAVVASHAIGSVPFLVEHGENGLIYKNNDTDELLIKVENLINDKSLREKFGKNAYRTISSDWNAKAATNNLLHLCDVLLNNEKLEIGNGPCSIAKPVKQWQMYRNCIQQ